MGSNFLKRMIEMDKYFPSKDKKWPISAWKKKIIYEKAEISPPIRCHFMSITVVKT